MNRKKLRKLKRRLTALRRRVGNIRSRELVGLAQSLGRKRDPRGKEPTYVSEWLRDAKPISIPNHPGSLSRFVAGNILDQFEQDLFQFEEMIDE
jgi:hypothetical protein